ncbi:MAG: hypothetical protein IKA41_03765 [Bacteroidaceae bacterium]|nr:hypothetical protein [Bacteroidaceae bacterium]
MKKTYVSPLTSEVSVMTDATMITASLQTFGDKTVDTTVSGTQLGNTHRGEWGNLWAK